MPSNSKTQNKKQASKKEVTETTQLAVAAPVQPEQVVQQVAVVVPVEQPVQVSAPEPSQQGGAKRGKRAASATSATQSAAPAKKAATGTASPAKSAAPKVAKSAAPAKAAGKTPNAPAKAAAKAPAKAAAKAAKGAAPKKAAKKATPKADADSEDTSDGKRSFKAMLPGSDQFEGRYTGLTPYQAANKALSKYYREAGEKATTEITFSIRESTRGSKRTVYTYNGRREKLATPVEYTIKGKDGERTVTKAFKNRLTKVKKADAPVAEASA
jgi:hypothetical protein